MTNASERETGSEKVGHRYNARIPANDHTKIPISFFLWDKKNSKKKDWPDRVNAFAETVRGIHECSTKVHQVSIFVSNQVGWADLNLWFFTCSI